MTVPDSGTDLAGGLSNLGGLDDLGPPSCNQGGAGGPELTFSWMPNASGSYTIDSFGSSFDTVLFVIQGACAGAEVACNDDTGGVGVPSQVTFNVTAATAYTIVVEGWDGDIGTVNLNITAP
jgi:hypothetical protein